MRYRHILRALGVSRPASTRRNSASPAHGRRTAVLEALEQRCVLSAGSLDADFDTDGLFSHEFESGTNERFTEVGQQSDGKLVFAGHSNNADIIATRLRRSTRPSAG